MGFAEVALRRIPPALGRLRWVSPTGWSRPAACRAGTILQRLYPSTATIRESTGDFGYRRVDGDELDQVAHGVEQWTTIEQESIDQAAGDGGGAGEDGQPPPPMPEEEL